MARTGREAMTTDSARDPRESGTLCQECNQRYRCDWNLSDAIWSTIAPIGVPAMPNLLCGICIAHRVEQFLAEAGEFAAFKVREIT